MRLSPYAATVQVPMYARAVDDAAARLHELHHEEREDLALGFLAVCVAVAAAEIAPSLAIPLFLGGLVVGARGLRALWRRWDMVDRLAAESDAYAIAEVLAYASRYATMESRRGFARSIRNVLCPSSYYEPAPVAVARSLEALAIELDDDRLTLDPDCAVACMRLLSDLPERRALYTVAWDDVRARVRHVRAGLRTRA
jgi:hypothetical protein